MSDSLGMRLKNIPSQTKVNFLPILYEKSKLKVVKLFIWPVAYVMLAPGSLQQHDDSCCNRHHVNVQDLPLEQSRLNHRMGHNYIPNCQKQPNHHCYSYSYFYCLIS